MPNAGSSVEHFYHFLLSYFLPIERHVARSGSNHIVVRDCGPMNVWFDVLPDNVRVDIVPKQEIESLRASPSNPFRSPLVLLPTLENKGRRRRSQIRQACARVRSRLGLGVIPGEGATTLIERLPGHPFFDTQAENLTAGTARRSIANSDELFRALNEVTPVGVFRGENMAPRDQVEMMSRTGVLVAQHGAGLANMVWMPARSSSIEILPRTTPSSVRFLFRDLAHDLGHAYVAVDQDDLHSVVDVTSISAMVTKLAH
jgi:hypothetical protein